MKHLIGLLQAARRRVSCTVLLACFCFVFAGTAHAQQIPDIVWKTNGHYDQITSVAITADATMVVSSSYELVRVWRVQDVTLLKGFTLFNEDVYAVAFSPNGNFLAEGGGGGAADDLKLRIWQTIDWAFVGRGGGSHNDSATAVAFSHDSSMVGFGEQSGHLVAIRTSDWFHGNTEEPPHSWVSSITFSPTECLLATAGREGTVKLWNGTNALADDQLLRTFSEHSGSVNSVAFLPQESQIASAGSDGKVIIRRITDGVVTRTLQDSNAIVSMAISPDGKTMFTVSTNLKFWRISDGALLAVYDQETQGIGPVAASANGKYFAYGRADGTVVLARIPLWVESITQTNGQITLQWQGGSGLYQLQSTTNVVNGPWQNVGAPTAATAATNAVTGTIFYRVQSLPNP